MSKSLKIIQTVMKVVSVILKIAFVFCIIGAVFGIISAAYCIAAENGAQTFLDFTIDGKAIKVLVVEEAGMPLKAVGAYSLSAGIICIGAAICTKIEQKYFEKELLDGTPFTFEGADLLGKTAINCLIISIAASFIAGLTFGILMFGTEEYNVDLSGTTIVSPLMMLFGSVIFRYGAEVSVKDKNENF